MDLRRIDGSAWIAWRLFFGRGPWRQGRLRRRVAVKTLDAMVRVQILSSTRSRPCSGLRSQHLVHRFREMDHLQHGQRSTLDPVQIWREIRCQPGAERAFARSMPVWPRARCRQGVAWKRQCCRTRGATASLDGVSTRGQAANHGSGRRNGLVRSNKETAHFFFPFLCSTAVPFLRPDLLAAMTPGAAAVKAGRRAGGDTLSALVRPRLGGGEHGVKLAAGRASPCCPS